MKNSDKLEIAEKYYYQLKDIIDNINFQLMLNTSETLHNVSLTEQNCTSHKRFTNESRELDRVAKVLAECSKYAMDKTFMLTFDDLYFVEITLTEESELEVTYAGCHYDLMVGHGKFGSQFVKDYDQWEKAVAKFGSEDFGFQSDKDIQWENLKAKVA